MDLMMSIHCNWIEMIFNKKKPLEFRRDIGRYVSVGDTVYMYETSKYHGRKKVVGEFKIKSINAITSRCGTYSLLPYYCEHILKDQDALNKVLEIYDIPLPDYDNSIKLSYIYCPEFIISLKDKGEFPNLLYMPKEKVSEYYKNTEKSKNLIKKCEDWLYTIGFYDDFGHSDYKYFIELTDIKKYDEPKDLSSFKNQKDEILTSPPQSWMYVK